jgi:hypothetical protein
MWHIGISPLILNLFAFGGTWCISRIGRFTDSTHWIRSWVVLRVCLVITEIQIPDRRVCSVVTTPTGLPRLNIREFLKLKTLFSFLVYLSTLSTAHKRSVTTSNGRTGYELEGAWNGAVEAWPVQKWLGKVAIFSVMRVRYWAWVWTR